MTYLVNVGEFEGPIGLLLQLISSHKLDLFSFSLATVVDDYLACLSEMESNDLEVSSDFVDVAATLVALKVRSLLPTPDDGSMIEELSGADERELLLLRLVEAAIYRDVSGEFAQRMAESSRTFPRAVGPDPEVIRTVADPLVSITIGDLTRALEALVDEDHQSTIDASHITVAPVGIHEVGARMLTVLLEASGNLPFREVVAFARSRYEVVVCFLVLLEAFRLGLVELEGQDGVQVSVASLADVETESRFRALLEELNS